MYNFVKDFLFGQKLLDAVILGIFGYYDKNVFPFLCGPGDGLLQVSVLQLDGRGLLVDSVEP